MGMDLPGGRYEPHRPKQERVRRRETESYGAQNRQAANKKREDFIQRLRDCEYELFRLPHPAIVNDSPGLSRLANSLFRDWLSERLAKGEGSQLGTGYAILHHSIPVFDMGMLKDSMRSFLRPHCKYNAELETTIKKLKPFLEDVFNRAEVKIQPILRDSTRLQDKSQHLCLTVMEIDDDEVPWATS